MNDLRDAHQSLDNTPSAAPASPNTQVWFRGITLNRLRGGVLFALGYLLSPLCWWNDLVFNLPVAYLFGVLCSQITPNWLLPGTIVGYWFSNILGILLMQFGVVDVMQDQNKPHNLKKELLTGIASSTVYTVVIVALVHFHILQLPDLSSIDFLHVKS